MNSKFQITIPKPCHKNWNTMTPKEKGRFCSSCAKTVIDFTKKTTEEIQEYLVENKNKRICGHFYKKQLDTITIEIPQVAFQQQLTFQKLFVLALLFVMGTTLFSCQYSDGKKQKIENVIVKDSIKVIEEDVGFIVPIEKEVDSSLLVNQKDSVIKSIRSKIPPPPKPTTGLVVYKKSAQKDSIVDITTIGKIVEPNKEGKFVDIPHCPSPEEEKDDVMGFIIIENPPRFKEAKSFSKEEAKKHFHKNIVKFIQDNFDIKTTQNLGLSEGKKRIYAQFIIDEKGNTSDIKVKAPHETLKKEALRIVEELPQFIPGKQEGKPVKTKYTLPITFYVE